MTPTSSPAAKTDLPVAVPPGPKPAGPVEFAFDRGELEAIFGALRVPKNWHRLEERISRFNRKGRDLGVRMSGRRETGEVMLSGRSLERVLRFKERLAEGTGYVQRAVAGLVAEKVARIQAPSALGGFHESQRRELAASLSGPLHFFPGIAPSMEQVFLDPPFRCETPSKAKTALETVLASARGASGRALIITGPSGLGKTCLLYKAFQALGAAGEAAARPVFLPANRIQFRPGQTSIVWKNLPGTGGDLEEHLEALFCDGKLVLFIDGLDENPRLLDDSSPAVWSFWGIASRNRCVITCRNNFYHRQFLNSPVHRILGASLGTMNLLEWTPAHARALYQRLAEAGPEGPLAAVAHLGRLTPEALRQRMGSIRLTGLSAWAYAVFFATHNGGRFPKTEFELLDYLTDLMVRWERGKAQGGVPTDILHGLLGRIAWRAYAKSQSGETLQADAEDVLDIVRKDYPFQLESKNALFAALNQIPVMSYEGYSGDFTLDRVFACFLAGKHILGMALRSDVEGLREALQTPLTYDVTNYVYQGLEGLDEAARRRVFESARKVFDAARQRLAVDPDPRHVTSMQAVLQPVGRLGLPEGLKWLQSLIQKPKDLPELVVLSCARALAYMGDEEAVTSYLRRLKRDAGAREIGRNFYLYWLRDGRPVRGGIDWLSGLRVDGWDRTCSWFLEQLASREFTSLRPIHLHTFCDLAETLGPARVRGEELKKALETVGREASSGGPLLKELAQRFRRHAEALTAA